MEREEEAKQLMKPDCVSVIDGSQSQSQTLPQRKGQGGTRKGTTWRRVEARTA